MVPIFDFVGVKVGMLVGSSVVGGTVGDIVGRGVGSLEGRPVVTVGETVEGA